jgi:hypothetical protein
VYKYKYNITTNKPKGEARGLNPETSPSIYTLTYALPTTRPTTFIVYKAQIYYLKIESAQCWRGGM